ncbi:hypothetical protein [Parasitella parasitica]|uniref:Uncharacterized protein n=1 Tax=Parasitella parasitica TaxID=35722 RepID=A0A0B7NM20_9FUNG|nr:hypothetical protein [Parasitella parasitica]
MLPNNNNNNTSRIPIPIALQQSRKTKAVVSHHEAKTVVVTPAKLDKKKNNNSRKSTLFSTTCSRMARETANYKKPTKSKSNNKPPLSSIPKNKMNRPVRKSPITQLKEDLEKLRQKKINDESLLKKQSKEIAKLQEQLKLHEEIKQELLRKEKLQSKLKAIAAEIQDLSTNVVDLLDVKSSDNVATQSYTDQIQELQSQLESREDNFKRKLSQYRKEMESKDECLRNQKAATERLKVEHANQIAQLRSTHTSRIHKLQLEHKKDLAVTKKPSRPSPLSTIGISHAIEQALNDFEQEQHNHPPPAINIFKTLTCNPIAQKRHAAINQQWYTKQYIPLDAMSWPTPQAAPNLRRQLQI